jgi:hypothetical protein
MSLAAGSKLGPYEIQSPLGASGVGHIRLKAETGPQPTFSLTFVNPLGSMRAVKTCALICGRCWPLFHSGRTFHEPFGGWAPWARTIPMVVRRCYVNS